jgi:hypothetical protein
MASGKRVGLTWYQILVPISWLEVLPLIRLRTGDVEFIFSLLLTNIKLKLCL